MRSSAILGLLVAASAAFAAPREIETNEADSDQCRSAVLMEPATGEILLERNSHERRPPASMVKMMVAYIAMERLKEGSLSKDEVITASPFSSKIGGSQVYLKQGEQFTVHELLQALMIQSANDAAVSIAEHLGGSSQGFVEMMNEQAKKLGMNETIFQSPHGLPPGKGQEADLTTAADLAVLGRAIIRNHPELLEMSKLEQAPFRGGTFVMTNHNHLVRSFPGTDGIKTGYYREAGFGVTVTAQRNGVRMLAVVMGCEQRKTREAEAATLLSKGFAQYKMTKLAAKGTAVGDPVRVRGGAVGEIVLTTGDHISGIVKAGEFAKVTQRPEPCEFISAPVTAGTPCGTVAYVLGEKVLARGPLVVPQDISAGGMVRKVRDIIGW